MQGKHLFFIASHYALIIGYVILSIMKSWAHAVSVVSIVVDVAIVVHVPNVVLVVSRAEPKGSTQTTLKNQTLRALIFLAFPYYNICYNHFFALTSPIGLALSNFTNLAYANLIKLDGWDRISPKSRSLNHTSCD